MTKIKDLICAPGLTGFYFDDQKAIKAGAKTDGGFYQGAPLTPGFTKVRQAGECISVMFRLDDGQIAYGDCAAVQYSGAAGRDPVFLAQDFIPVIESVIAPKLRGRSLEAFRPLAEEIDRMAYDGRPLHTALRYGVTQTILDAVAKAQRRLPCEVIADEYNTIIADRPIPLFTQSGDNRYDNADKMIIKQADILPHALINNVLDKLGEDGGKLLDYIRWLRDRILQYRLRPDYNPTLHIDVYGTIGLIYDNDITKMADYIARLGQAAAPFKLQIEGPMDMGARDGQCKAMAKLRQRLHDIGAPIGIIADEWCNTLEDTRYFADAKAADMIQIKTPDLGGINNSIEAVLYCKQQGVGAYLGGTCNETDYSARMCAHIALATQPDQMLAKPGMGVDEGLMIVRNEMSRALTCLASRTGKGE